MIPYRPDLKEKARDLRLEMTPAERKLWYEFLRACPQRWYRQKPLLDFIVDFYCHSLALVLEIDGDSHISLESQRYDQRRTEKLGKYGIRIMRFTNDDVLARFESVCMDIMKGMMDKCCKSP